MFNGLPWKWTEIILLSLRLHPSISFWTLVDYEGYSISSDRFFPIVVNITVILINLPIPIHFNSLIPKMLMFTLAFSCLITSNLPWFMDLTFQVPMHYCSLQHLTLLSPPDTSIAGFCFYFYSASFFLELLVIALHSSPVTYWTPSKLGVHLVFSYGSWVSHHSNTRLVWHSFLQY